MTMSDLYSSPFSRATPKALPFLMMTFSTGLSVIMVAPKCFADLAMAILTSPVPPL